MERMVKLEEQKSQLDRRTEGTEKAVQKLGDKLDEKFEKLADKFEKKIGDAVSPLWTENKATNEKLNNVIMRVVWISAMLSACGGIVTLIGRELVTKLIH
jgi:predicted nuclease with TOPRIM domain